MTLEQSNKKCVFRLHPLRCSVWTRSPVEVSRESLWCLLLFSESDTPSFTIHQLYLKLHWCCTLLTPGGPSALWEETVQHSVQKPSCSPTQHVLSSLSRWVFLIQHQNMWVFSTMQRYFFYVTGCGVNGHDFPNGALIPTRDRCEECTCVVCHILSLWKSCNHKMISFYCLILHIFLFS